MQDKSESSKNKVSQTILTLSPENLIGRSILRPLAIQMDGVKLLQEQRFLNNISENSISDVVRKNL